MASRISRGSATRGGITFFISMMQAYYDRREEPNFERLFGGLWLGAHPTGNRNRYLVLPLDFSKVGGMGGATRDENPLALVGKGGLK